MNAIADGTTKNVTRRKALARRVRMLSARAVASPVALDISGSSAAEIAMPNKLTGSR